MSSRADPEAKEAGALLRTLREGKGVSLRQLATMAGYRSHSDFSRVEEGSRRPSDRVLRAYLELATPGPVDVTRLARLYDIDIEAMWARQPPSFHARPRHLRIEQTISLYLDDKGSARNCRSEVVCQALHDDVPGFTFMTSPDKKVKSSAFVVHGGQLQVFPSQREGHQTLAAEFWEPLNRHERHTVIVEWKERRRRSYSQGGALPYEVGNLTVRLWMPPNVIDSFRFWRADRLVVSPGDPREEAMLELRPSANGFLEIVFGSLEPAVLYGVFWRENDDDDQ